MDEKPPFPEVAPVEPAGSPRRVPSLFVEQGDNRTSVIAADDPPARDQQDVLRAREKRRKQQEAERLKAEAELVASVRRIRNAVLLFIVVGAVVWGGWWVRQKWGGEWPVFFTWSVIAVVMLGGFGWALWYTERA